MSVPDSIQIHPLNPMLRLAVLAGAESAVSLHIARGDDLDARDGNGLTPLMLAASKNRTAIASLLVAAGAKVSLTDSLGRDAHAIAMAAKAAEVVSILEAVVTKVQEAVQMASIPDFVETDNSHKTSEFFSDEVGNPVDLSAWEPEVDGPAPLGDETIAVKSGVFQQSISAYKPIDTYDDWGEFDVFFPERSAPLPQAGNEDGRNGIRKVLLQGLLEGSVPECEIVRLCENEDGSRNEESEALLRLVLSEIGAETDERIDTYFSGNEREESFFEHAEIHEAIKFLDELDSSGNEPLRLYVKDMRVKKLLTAEQEISLGRSIEEGASEALDALASWPEGLGLVIEAARRVRSGQEDVGKYSNVSAGSLPSEDHVIDEDGDDEEEGGKLTGQSTGC